MSCFAVLYWSGFHPVAKSEGLHPDIQDKQILTTIPEAITELRRVVLQEKVWVLGTRTAAWVGKVRLAIFRGRKRIPLKQEALNDLESGSRKVIPDVVDQGITGLPFNPLRA